MPQTETLLSTADPTVATTAPPHLKSRYFLLLLVTWIICSAYTAHYLKRGWIPHDEAAVAHSAERTMNGELPHRDFDDIYTGGLTFLHALAFRELGVNLVTPRYVQFVFFIAWIPAMFYVATRFLSDFLAAIVVFMAVLWSVPNYAAPAPAAYNLFFAVFGAAALFRYLERNSTLLLFLAGLCGGISILAKLTGLFYIAAVLIFLIFHEQFLDSDLQHNAHRQSWLYRLFITLGLTLFIAALAILVRKVPAVSDLFHFFLPSLALVLVVLYREFFGAYRSGAQRFATLFRLLWPVVLGIVTPLLVFSLPYLLTRSLPALLHGVLMTITKRFGIASTPPPRLLAFIPPIALAFLLCLAIGLRGIWRQVCAAAVALSLAAVLIESARLSIVYRLGWTLLGVTIPLIVLAGAVILAMPRPPWPLSPLQRQRLLLILLIAALGNMVQFPNTWRIYFIFAAPFALLAGAALLALVPRPPRLAIGSLLVFYTLFAVMRITPAFLQMGWEYHPDTQTARLSLPRAGGLRVDPAEARIYEELIPILQSHTSGPYIYAGPDCSDVYFLSGLKNPTRTEFDFFDDPDNRDQRILSLIDTHDVLVAAIWKQPVFSRPVDPQLKGALDERFPIFQEVGPFEVRWSKVVSADPVP